jgi:hypothetical protein
MGLLLILHKRLLQAVQRRGKLLGAGDGDIASDPEYGH